MKIYGKKGEKIEATEIENILDLDDAFVRDYTDRKTYYIKDDKIYSLDGNNQIVLKTYAKGKLYLEYTVFPTEEAEDYATIIVTPIIGGIPKFIGYEEYLLTTIDGKTQEEKEQLLLKGCNDVLEMEGSETRIGSYEELLSMFSQSFGKEIKTTQDLVEAMGCTTFDELLTNSEFAIIMIYKDYMEYYQEYSNKYDNEISLMMTTPDEQEKSVSLTQSSISYPVTENGQYEFSAKYGDQTVTIIAEVNNIKEKEMYELAKESENTYKIETIEDLVGFSQNVNNGNSYKNQTIKLINSLDFNDDASYKNPNNTTFGDYNKDGVIEGLKQELTTGSGFIPIGSKYISAVNLKYDFKGIFDGNNNEIKDLYINNAKTSYVGLFGINYGEIKDFTIDGQIISDNTTRATIGGISSYNYGIITNIDSKINITSESNNYYIGGICGYNDNAKIINCRNIANINIERCTRVGGIAGDNSGIALIRGCGNTGNIIIKTAQEVGGIIGGNNTIDAIVNKCYNIGNITVLESAKGVGGIGGGYNDYSGVIVNCCNTGNIITKGEENYAGGIKGYQKYGFVVNCYNMGNIQVVEGTPKYVAGILADQDGTRIVNCYNAGDITVKGDNTFVGGISGSNYYANITKNIYNYGKLLLELTDTSKVGGITGQAYGEQYQNGKYLEGTWTKGIGNRADGAGSSETCTMDEIEEMLNVLNEEIILPDDYVLPEEATFCKWKIVEGVNNGFPIFEWQGGTNE